MSSNKLFLALILVSIILIIWGRTSSGKGFQLASARIISLLQKPITYSVSLMDARRENQKLRQKIIELSVEKELYKSYKFENTKLKELLSYRDKSSYELIAAEVVGTSPYSNEGVILINKGLADGIQKGMVCITTEGLLGIVTDGDNKVSVVETLHNQGFTASAMDTRTRAVGILRQKNGLFLHNVPLSSSIYQEDTIITSGLGGVFPKGIPIGTILDVEKSGDMLFHVARVNPFVPYVVEFVFVMTTKPTEEIPVTTELPKVKVEKPLPKTVKPPIGPILPEPRIRE